MVEHLAIRRRPSRPPRGGPEDARRRGFPLCPGKRVCVTAIVCIKEARLSFPGLRMSGLFDVSQETILGHRRKRRGWGGSSRGCFRRRRRGCTGGTSDRQTEKPRRRYQGRAAAVPSRCRWMLRDMAIHSRAIDAAEAALGPITVLINNAGIAVEKLAVEQTEADWDSVIGVNLKGAYFTATEVARRMVARKQSGNIVNIASVLGFGVMKFLSPYTISKAGIVQATKAMALELAGQPHPRQCAGPRLYRHRDEPRVLGDARG